MTRLGVASLPEAPRRLLRAAAVAAVRLLLLCLTGVPLWASPAAAGPPAPAAPAAVAEPESAEYEVYRALLDGKAFSDSRYVLLARAVVPMAPLTRAQQEELQKSGMQPAHVAALASLREHPQGPAVIGAGLGKTRRKVRLTNATTPTEPGDDPGLTQLSRVAFDETKTFALVRASNGSLNELIGGGLFCLTRRQGRWVIGEVLYHP